MCVCVIVNMDYFDIQVMIVTETEMLTSTLHHNIFTNLDYAFSATFIYMYIYIYIYVCVCACNAKQKQYLLKK